MVMVSISTGTGSGFGYANVADQGFVAFDRELNEAPWSSIATKKYDDAAKDSLAALRDAPLQVVWKIRLRRGIARVLAALGAKSIVDLDAAWDGAQRRLQLRIDLAAASEDASVRAAAEELREQLLVGPSGTAQIIWNFDDEIDFGRTQIARTQPGEPLAAAVKKLKLEPELSDIAKKTEALAEGFGRGTGEKRRTPSKQVRAAMTDCIAAFNAVHNDLVWLRNETSSGPDRDLLTALLAPLEALLSRNTPAAAKEAGPAAPEALAAPAPPAPDTKPA